MNQIKNHVIRTLQVISCSCVAIYLLVLVFYFYVFNDGLSHKTNDWNLFVLIFGGVITAILSTINIYAIIQINVAIEGNNEQRHIKNTIFEAQTILAKMRFDRYDRISHEIINIQASFYKKEIPMDSIENLKKMLMEMDNSFLFRGQKLSHATISQTLGHDIVVQINSIIQQVKKCGTPESHAIESLQQLLSQFLSLLEFHIIAQLVRGLSVQNYIAKNKDNIDCAISSSYEFAEELLKKSEREKGEDKASLNNRSNL
jgi:hypothetical protein